MKENEVDEREETSPLSAVEDMGRRGFLQKMVMAAMALATAFVGAPQKAEALVTFGCCALCKSSTSCTGACCWTWGCCHAGDQDRFYRCKECYSASAACNGSCTGVVCSQGTRTQLIC